MRWTSIVAIFTLFWVLSAFLVMPFGVRTPEEAGVDLVPGQVHSAPANFSPGLILRRASILAVILFVVYYQIYVHGWISVSDLDVLPWIMRSR